MASVYTTKEFVTRAIDKHGDIYDYSMSNYTNMVSKVTIICTTHVMFHKNGGVMSNE